MEKLIQQFFNCVENLDATEIVHLFTENAIINSPLYGECPANLFFQEVFTDMIKAKIILHDTFFSKDKKSAACVYEYQWTFNTGATSSCEFVDIFTFNDPMDKITNLKIIYDTWSIREKFSTMKKRS